MANSKIKVTRSVKHDSMWLKLWNGKEYIRLSVGRRGYKVAVTQHFVNSGQRLMDMFQGHLDDGKNYLEAFDLIEAVYLEIRGI